MFGELDVVGDVGVFKRRRNNRQRDATDQDQALAFSELVDEYTGTSIIGNLGSELHAADRRRAWRLHQLLLFARPTLLGIVELREAIDWLAGAPGLHPEVAFILRQATHRITHGVEALLSEAPPRAMEESRYLIEVEFLLLDFLSDPWRIDQWAGLPQYKRNREYGFGALRAREEQRRALPTDQVAPDRDEYRTHSVRTHPAPSTDQPTEGMDGTQTLLIDASDLLQHSLRVLRTALGFLDGGAIDMSGMPLPPALANAKEAWTNVLPRNDGQVAERPTSVPLHHDLFGTDSKLANEAFNRLFGPLSYDAPPT